MKIELNDWEDVKEFIALVNPAYLRAWNAHLGPSVIAERERDPVFVRQNVIVSPEAVQAAGLVEPDGLPTDIERPVNSRGQTYDEVVAATAKLHEAIIGETLDADGVVHSTDWHSDPPKINADGRWRARRKRDEDAYKAWLLEQAVQVDEAAAAADAEPVATETHALPQGVTLREEGAEELEIAEENAILEGDVEAPVDLAALVEASQEAALDASDSHMDLIKACQAFISDHGHPAYNALKAAVAPLEGAENGKAVPQFTPAERRLMRACIANYPKGE